MLVHGWPPHQNAGTEGYAFRVAEGMRNRGWDVLAIAASPGPGRRMYEVTRAPGLVRITNNAPYAGLRSAASDPAIDRIVGGELSAWAPDLVHVQHLQNLSVTVPMPAPVVWTLHDAWAWCAAGGILLRDDQPCDGPNPACAGCASGWARDPALVSAAIGLAGRLGRVIPPSRLHAAWRAVPSRLRDRVNRAPAPPVTVAHIDARLAAIRAFAARCAAILSPSRWLATEAARQGLDARHLPHGVDASPIPRSVNPASPFLFLGTLAPHKGPALVVEAHRRAGLAAPLLVHGPPGPDAAYASSLPHAGPVDARAVPTLLATSRALVLGSTWPENAPLVVLEARAAGCPVIAPAIGGIPEILDHGIDGWLYPTGDVGALASMMRLATEIEPPVRPPPTFSDHLDALSAVYVDAMEASR